MAQAAGAGPVIRGCLLFIPENFARELVRGERPVFLMEADATKRAATRNAVAALPNLEQTARACLQGTATDD